MGNTHHNSRKCSPLSQFIITNTHPLQYYSQIKHKKTGQTLLAKKITPENHFEAMEVKNLIDLKMNNKSPFVTQLVHWEETDFSEICSFKQNIILLFNNAGITLAEYLDTANKKGKSITDMELANILEQVLKGLKYFSIINHLHDQITPQTIFYDGSKAILIDPWLNCQNITKPLKRERKQFENEQYLYKSPQRQMHQMNYAQSYNKLQSNLYELGLLVLDLATNGKYTTSHSKFSKFNDKNQLNFYQSVSISSLLQELQDFNLKSKLNVILNPNSQKRITIFNIIVPQRIALKQFNSANKANFSNMPHRRIPTDYTLTSYKKHPRSLSKAKISKNDEKTKTNSEVYKGVTDKYLSYQATPERRSLQKNVLKTEQRHQSIDTSPGGSTFTYAQWLPAFTQSNETPVISRKQSKQLSIKGINNSNPTTNSNWPHPHKILQINKNYHTSRVSSSSTGQNLAKGHTQLINNGKDYGSWDKSKRQEGYQNYQQPDRILQNRLSQQINLMRIEQQSFRSSNRMQLSSAPITRKNSKTNLIQVPYHTASNSRYNSPDNQSPKNSSAQKSVNKNVTIKFNLVSPQPIGFQNGNHFTNPEMQFTHMHNRSSFQQNKELFVKQFEYRKGIYSHNRSISESVPFSTQKQSQHAQYHPIIIKQLQKKAQNKNQLNIQANNANITRAQSFEGGLNRQLSIQSTNKSKHSKASSPQTPYFHHQSIFNAPSFGNRTNSYNENQTPKIIIQENFQHDIEKKTRTIQSLQEEDQEEEIKMLNRQSLAKQDMQKQKRKQTKNTTQNSQQTEKNHQSNYLKIKSLQNSDIRMQKSLDTDQIKASIDGKSINSKVSYIKVSSPTHRKQSLQQYNLNINNSDEKIVSHERNANPQKQQHIPHSNQNSQNGGSKGHSHKNSYASDLQSAKQTESIIFDSDLKKEAKKYSKNRKPETKIKTQQQQAIHQVNMPFSHIGFGKQQPNAKKENGIQKIINSSIQKKQKTNITKTVSLNSQNSLRLQEKTESIIVNQNKDTKLPNAANYTETNNQVIKNKPSLSNQPGKLVFSIDNSPIASIESVVQFGFSPAHFLKLNGQKQKITSINNDTSKTNSKEASFKTIININTKIKSQRYSQNPKQGESSRPVSNTDCQMIRKQVINNAGIEGNSSDRKLRIQTIPQIAQLSHNTLINILPNSEFSLKSALDTGNANINNYNFSSSDIKKQIVYNLQSNQSLKYYVIENYPLPNSSQLKQRYEGYKSEGIKEGHGTYYHANGDIYHGQWHKDKPHGFGGIYRHRQIKGTGRMINITTIISKNIIHNKQQYETICEGLWAQGQFIAPIQNSLSYWQSSNPISPPSSSRNVINQQQKNKYNTSIANLLPANLKTMTSYQGSYWSNTQSFSNGPSLAPSIQNHFKYESNNSIAHSLNYKIKNDKQVTSKYSIDLENQSMSKGIKKQPGSNQIIKLGNGDIFKGKAQFIGANSENTLLIGKVYQKNGEAIQGNWIYKDNQITEFKNASRPSIQ